MRADVAQRGSRELGEEALDEIGPGAVLGGEGELEATLELLGEPSLGLLGDVCGMIVEDQLDRCVRGIGGVEKLEEFDEFAAAVAILVSAPGIVRLFDRRPVRLRQAKPH